MNTYIALLRGINVGGKNKLPMKELVSAMTKAGFSEVKTYIQSGNVVFQADNAEEEALSALIESNFGFKPAVMLLTPEQLTQAVQNNPFDEPVGKLLHLFFCSEVPNYDLSALEALKTATESFQLIDNVFYLHAPDGIGRSKLAEKVERILGVPATCRNLNTVNKLMTMI